MSELQDFLSALSDSPLVTRWPQFSKEQQMRMTFPDIRREAREKCKQFVEDLPEHEARSALWDYRERLEQLKKEAQAVVDDPDAAPQNDEGAYVMLTRARLQLPIVRRFVRDFEARKVGGSEGEESSKETAQDQGGRGWSDEDLGELLLYTLDEFQANPTVTNFKTVLEGVSKSLGPGKPHKSGVRHHLGNNILPRFQSDDRFSDLDLPEGLDTDEWDEKLDAVVEAEKRWREDLQT